MKKKTVTLLVTALITAAMVITCIPAYAAEIVEDIPTIQAFTGDPVAEEDLVKIINAGINAPSAINQQPWHFSVVTDPAVMDQIANGGGDSSGDSGDSQGESAEGAAPAGDSEGESADDAAPAGDSEGGAAAAKASVGDSPVLIVISCAAEATGTTPAFDAGLACMNMVAEANLLGYGTKIISSPTMVLNGAKQDEFREILGIPADMSAVAVLLIGVSAQEEADIVSSASTRNTDEVVTYIAP